MSNWLVDYLDPAEGESRMSKALEPPHRPPPPFYTTVGLFGR